MKCRIGVQTHFSACGGGKIRYSAQGEADCDDKPPGSGRLSFTPTKSGADNSANGGIKPPLPNLWEGGALPDDIP